MSNSLYFPTHIGLLDSVHRENIGPALWEFLWFISKTTKEVHEDGEMIGIVLGGRPIKVSEIAEESNVSERTVTRNITRLKKYDYIKTKRTPYGEIFYVRNSKKFYKNRNAKSGTSDASKEKGDMTHMPRDMTDMSERNAKSGTSNKIKKDKEKINNIYVEIIEYLNQKTGKRYSPKSAANQKLINGRMSEGRTLEDFKHVIDVKVDEWLNNEEMQKYLRPETLFNNKFENYLNQKPKFKTEKQSDPRDREIALQKWITNGNDPNEFNWND